MSDHHELPPRIGQVEEAERHFAEITSALEGERGSITTPLGQEFVLKLVLDGIGEHFWTIPATCHVWHFPKTGMLQFWLGTGQALRLVYLLMDGAVLAHAAEDMDLGTTEPTSSAA